MQFFKAIDGQFQALINSTNLNAKAIESILLQTNQLLPELNNLKFELDMLDDEAISIALRNDILKLQKYIKGIMVLSQVPELKEKLFTLLEQNIIKLEEEKKLFEQEMQNQLVQQKKAEEEKKEIQRLESEKQKAVTSTQNNYNFLTITAQM